MDSILGQSATRRLSCTSIASTSSRDEALERSSLPSGSVHAAMSSSMAALAAAAVGPAATAGRA
jgi:hypothetical protein